MHPRVGDIHAPPKTVPHDCPAPMIPTGPSLSPPPLWRLPIASALRRTFAKGYRTADLGADILAGTVVGIVALPLSMALAIGVGAPPQHGLYTAVVAGAVVALLGGCKFQVTGSHGRVHRHSRAHPDQVRAFRPDDGRAHGGRAAGRDGRRASRPPHSIHPSPGDDRVHHRDRHGDRDAPAQRRDGARRWAPSRSLHGQARGPMGGKELRKSLPSSLSRAPRWRSCF